MLHRLLCLRFSFLVHGNWYVLPLCVHQNVLKLLFAVALVGAFDGHLVKLASHAESQRFATNFVVFAAVGLLGRRHLVCDRYPVERLLLILHLGRGCHDG